MLREYVASMCGSSSVSANLESVLCDRIRSCKSPLLVDDVLRIVARQQGRPEHVAGVAEAALEHCQSKFNNFYTFDAIQFQL